MRKLVVNTFVTLDGVMQAPGGPEEDPTGGFEHGGWSFTYWDDAMGENMGECMGKPFDLVLGRRTYEIFAAPLAPQRRARGRGAQQRDQARGLARRSRSSTGRTRTSSRATCARAIRKLKEEDGPELQVHGSAELIQTLLEHGLVDEFRVWIFPVVIGKGKRLFGDGTVPAGLKLTDSLISSTGVIMAAYEPAGEIPIGSFALEEPTEAEVERREKIAE